MKMAFTTSVVCVLLLGIFTSADSAAVATQDKNGVSVQCPPTYKVDLYVLVDASNSIPDIGMQRLQTSLGTLIQQLPIGPTFVQIAFGKFNSVFTHIFNLNKYSKVADIIKQVQAKVKCEGMTNLAGALKQIQQGEYLTSKAKGSRDGTLKKLCIFTDGNSDDPKLTLQEANKMRAQGIGIHVFTIGLVDIAEAIAIAGGASNVHSATSFATVSTVLNAFVQRICQAAPPTTTTKPTTTTPKPTTATTKPTTTTPKPTTTTPKPKTTTPKPTTTTPKPTTTTPKPTTTTPKPTTTTPKPTTTTPEPTTTTPEPTTTTPEPTTTTPEPTTKKACSSAQMDLIIAVDASGSIGIDNFQFNCDFIDAFLDWIQIGESQKRMGLFTFGTYPEQVLSLTGDIQLIKQAIANLPYQGSTTETHLVINAAITEYILHGKPGFKRVLIIITDGLSSSPELTLALANVAKNLGIYIMCIGVGDKIDPNELRNVSSSGTFLFAKDYSELPALIDSLGQDTCNAAPEPTTNTPEPKTTAPKPTSIAPESTTTTPEPTTTAEKPPQQPPPVTSCSPATQMDVAFLIDSSGSMGKKNFQFNCDMINRYVDAVAIGESTIRVAVFTYGTHPNHVCGLTGDIPTIRKGISAMKYQGSTTETHLGLEMAMGECKIHKKPGVSQMVVHVTDGQSSTPDLTLSKAREVKDAGIKIIVMAVGALINEQECRSVSSSGTIMYVDQYLNLPNMTASVSQETCQAASMPITGDPDNDSDSSSDSSSSESDEQCAAA